MIVETRSRRARFALERLEDRTTPTTTITVTAGTQAALDAAITAAKALATAATPDTARLDFSQLPQNEKTISITRQLDIENVVEIVGAGTKLVRGLNNNVGNWSILNVSGVSVNAVIQPVQIRDLTVTGGSAMSPRGYYSHRPLPPSSPVGGVDLYSNNIAGSVGGGLRFGGGDLVLKNCEFTNNHASLAGGGVYFFGRQLTVTDSVFYDNTTAVAAERGEHPGLFATGGGAIAVMRSNLVDITGSVFTGNKAGGVTKMVKVVDTDQHPFYREESYQAGLGDGGAVLVYDYHFNPRFYTVTRTGHLDEDDERFSRFSTVVNVTDSNFRANTAGRFGGAVSLYSYRDYLTSDNRRSLFRYNISRSSFVQNQAVTGSGGALWTNVRAGGHTLESDQSSIVSDSTFDGNSAAYGGVALAIYKGFGLARNLTVTANQRTQSNAKPFQIDLEPSLQDSEQQRLRTGAFVTDAFGDSQIILHNSAFWSNAVSDVSSLGGGNVGTFRSWGTNFFSRGGSFTPALSDQVGTPQQPLDAKLSPLKTIFVGEDNKYWTRGRVPLPGSPLIDKGQDKLVTISELDQIQKTRKVGKEVDIGAIEVQPPTPPLPPPLASVGDWVWDDTNGNGIQDPEESGLEGVEVALHHLAYVPTAATTTDANGSYALTNLIPGEHALKFTAPSAASATALYGSLWKDDDADGVKDAGEIRLNDVQVTLFASDGSFLTSTTTDADGMYAFGALETGTYTMMFADPLSGSAIVACAGTLWHDDDPDGLKDATESGIDTSIDYLRRTDVVADTTTTDTAGNYEFSDLDAGEYYVAFTALTGYSFTAPLMGRFTSDSDVVSTSESPLVGKTTLFTLARGEDNVDVDAGLYQLGAISGSVWSDANENGTRDTGEGAVSGVDIDVLDAFGTAIVSTVTDGSGNYQFADLAPGDYKVRVNTTRHLAALDQGSDDTKDSDFDLLAHIAPIQVGSGQTAAHIDAGLLQDHMPVATSDTYFVERGESLDVVGGVLTNDTDAENDALSAELVDDVRSGTLTLNSDGTFTYTPDAYSIGTVTFTYRPIDSRGAGDLATVFLFVANGLPEAVDDSASTAEDSSVVLDVLNNDSDTDVDPLSILGVSGGEHGTVAINDNGTESDPTDDYIVFSPALDWSGTDAFTYWISDGFGGYSYATATVTVDPVNDTPTIGGATIVSQKNTPIDIDLRTRVTDIETALTDVTFAVSSAYHGTVTLLSDGYTARFTPDTDYYGGAFFSVDATDDGDGSAAPVTANGYVNLSVNAPPTVAAGVAVHLAPGQTVSFYAFFSDPDGDPWVMDGYTQPAYGSVSPDSLGYTFNYTAPTTPFVGITTFTITLSDDRGGTTTQEVTVELLNQPPQGDNASLTTAMNTPLYIYAPYWDPDGDAVSVAVVQPEDGHVSLDQYGSMVYTPPTDFTGEVTFSFIVDDGYGGTHTIYVTVTVA